MKYRKPVKTSMDTKATYGTNPDKMVMKAGNAGNTRKTSLPKGGCPSKGKRRKGY